MSAPCTQCGSAVPEGAPFCLACGTPVSSRTRAVALGVDPAPLESSAWRPAPVDAPLSAESLLPAYYGRRVLAFLIDAAISTVVTLVVVAIVALAGGFTSARPGAIAIEGGPFVIVVAGSLLYPLAELLLQSFRGYTVGKKLLGLRVVRFDTFQTPGIVRMIIRTLIVGVSGLALGIGRLVVYLSPLWDPAGLLRGWHDRLARTWVIDVVRGPNPLRIGSGVITGSPRAAEPAPVPAVAPVGAPGSTAAVTTAAPAAVPGLDADLDNTRVADPQRAAAAAAPGTGRTAPTRIALRFDSGELVTIDRAGVLGRDPVSPDGGSDALLVAVPGDGSSVSKTHLDLDTTPSITDRGSTNGTRLVRGGITTLLEPGVRTPVAVGDTVRIGTRSFTVEEVAAR